MLTLEFSRLPLIPSMALKAVFIDKVLLMVSDMFVLNFS